MSRGVVLLLGLSLFLAGFFKLLGVGVARGGGGKKGCVYGKVVIIDLCI